MALEPAGVSLEAKGLAAYINALDKIDKKQKAVFEVVAKDTGKTIKEVTAAARKQQKALNDLAKAEKKAADEAKKLAAAQKTAAATSRSAFISTAQAVIAMTKQVATAAFELGKLGAQFEGQQIGLNNLAGGFGQSGKAIQQAIQQASKGTVSDLQSINAANQALLLGVAKTPAEFTELTNSALTLGRTLGLSATQSLEQFTTALGRQSLLILDNFGISAKQVNSEIERLAQADFGKARSQLTDAQKQATFMKAALQIAGEAAATIGEEAGNAQASFDRLTAASENFKTELGLALSDLNQSLGITEGLAKNINRARDGIKELRGAQVGASLEEQIESVEIKLRNLQKVSDDTRASLEESEGGFDLFGIGKFLDETALKTQTAALAELQAELDALNLQKVAKDQEEVKESFDATEPEIKDNTEAIKAYEAALKQAQDLQLSFAREAEDAARKLARANEDVARKQTRQVAKLQERQAKDRDKLLKDQAKQLDRFEADRRKQISQAENEIREARKEAGEERKRDQQKLQRELNQARERFNLSQLQSERRFKLQESRLRAEGDILGLKELREDFVLTRQEEKENFDLSKKEQVSSAKEQQKEQNKDLEKRLKTLKTDLEDRRADLLASFDEQLRDQQAAQEEAGVNQQIAFAEQAEDRAIALQREEEDRRISQRRQLEDLGRSLAEQKDITAEGVNAIAGEIERVFGMNGVANNIIVGFSQRTRSEFNDLVDNVENTIKELDDIEKKRDIPVVRLTGDVSTISGGNSFGQRRSTPAGVQAFQEGGVVQGPIGSPQIVQAHAGETILPTHQRSFQATAPVIPSQSLEVLMSGGFNITGDGQANDAILQAAAEEMTENFRIAVRRLARRN